MPNRTTCCSPNFRNQVGYVRIDDAGNVCYKELDITQTWASQTVNGEVIFDPTRCTGATPTPVLTSITIVPTSASIGINSTTQLTATCKDQNGSTMICPALTWISSDTTKVTVSPSGSVTGIAIGTANITAKSGYITSNISTITVTPPPILTSITVSPSTTSVDINGTTQLTAICKDQNNNTVTCPVMTWSSSDTTKVTVSPSGSVTGIAIGTANITAKSGYITSNTSTVTVTTLPQISLQQIVENVTSSIGYRYQSRDSANNVMDTIKIIQNPVDNTTYLGVYHTLISGTFRVKLATSTDLKNWTYKVDLDNNSSQPYITSLSDGGFIVAMEATAPNLHLRFKHYANLNSLLTGTTNKIFDAPRTIPNAGAEGTPNIYSAILSPDINNSVIDVGFHYFRNSDVDRQARGTLTNFSTWTAIVEAQVNSTIEALGVQGNIGDRDNIIYGGKSYNIIEGQLTKGNWASWRCFLYDWQTNTAVQLNIKTHKGSTAFANPSYTKIRDPSGNLAIVTTLFIPSEGAASGEAGELIYYSRISDIMRWKCSGAPNFTCVQATDGIYDTQTECQAVCQPPIMRWKCSGAPNFTCVQATDGTYGTQAECQAACHIRYFTPAELQTYNGKNGQPAYVALNSDVYDVTSSPTWPNGNHESQHVAGNDLTNVYPHNISRMSPYPIIGKLIETPILTSITIAPVTASINVNTSVQLTAICKDQNNNTMTCPILTWTSSDPSEAIVDNTGKVTGITAGMTNITAKSGSITSNASVITVSSISPILTSITIAPVAASININASVQLTAICKDQNNDIITCPVLIWTSSEPSKATVDSTGKVTGITAGMTNITAKSGTIVSNASTITITSTPIEKKFDVYIVGDPNNPSGVLVVKNIGGAYTASEACQAACNILNTIN